MASRDTILWYRHNTLCTDGLPSIHVLGSITLILVVLVDQIDYHQILDMW